MAYKYLKNINKSQAGYASFVITLVTIIVVSLIVVAFSSDSRLEQKNSLANTEATQAYYAAESGINDAYAVVKSDLLKNITPPSTNNNCASSGSAYVNASSNQLQSNNVQYTCLVVNPTPNFLQYDGVEPGKGLTIPIDTNNSNNVPGQRSINWINVSWEDSSLSASPVFSSCPNSASTGANLPQLGSYNCDAGVLQLDIISGSNFNNDISSNNPFSSQPTTVFLEPVNYSGANGTDQLSVSLNQDQVYPVDCGATPAGEGKYACTQSIPVPSDNKYYLHLQSFYSPSTNVYITVTHSNPNSNNLLYISGSEVLIDSTGEANGQLKRLEETVCANVYCSSLAPSAALESTYCIDKNFGVYPGASDTPVSIGGC